MINKSPERRGPPRKDEAGDLQASRCKRFLIRSQLQINLASARQLLACPFRVEKTSMDKKEPIP